MAINTAARRFSMLNMRAPWMVRPLPIPDGASWDATQRYEGLNLYSGLTAGAPPPFVTAGFYGGTAVDATGVMGTIFLDDVTAVPGSAVFIKGFAHSQAGMRYVALWPSSNKVYYFGEIARRSDGAMCILTSVVPSENTSGIALTARGEVIASTSSPELVHEGFGLRANGALCVSAAS